MYLQKLYKTCFTPYRYETFTNKAVDVRQSALDKLQEIADQAQEGRRLSKARRRYIKKLQLIAFVSDNAATIRDALVLNGIQVLNAAFEADVLIAQNPFCMG